MGDYILNGVVPILAGRTHTGSVTIALLEINRFEAVEFREYLIARGIIPARADCLAILRSPGGVTSPP